MLRVCVIANCIVVTVVLSHVLKQSFVNRLASISFVVQCTDHLLITPKHRLSQNHSMTLVSPAVSRNPAVTYLLYEIWQKRHTEAVCVMLCPLSVKLKKWHVQAHKKNVSRYPAWYKNCMQTMKTLPAVQIHPSAHQLYSQNCEHITLTGGTVHVIAMLCKGLEPICHEFPTADPQQMDQPVWKCHQCPSPACWQFSSKYAS